MLICSFFLFISSFFQRFALCLSGYIILFQLSSHLLHDIAYVLTALIANIRFKSVEIKSKHDFKCANTIKWLHLWYLVKGTGEDVCVCLSVCVCACASMTLSASVFVFVFACLYFMKIKTNRIWQMYNYIDAFSTVIRQFFVALSLAHLLSSLHFLIHMNFKYDFERCNVSQNKKKSLTNTAQINYLRCKYYRIHWVLFEKINTRCFLLILFKMLFMCLSTGSNIIIRHSLAANVDKM